MFGRHLRACKRFRDTATGRIDYEKVYEDEKKALKKQDEAFASLSTEGVLTANVQDDRWTKPLAKLPEIKKRMRQAGLGGGKKYSAADVRRAAKTDMVDMFEYSRVRRTGLRQAPDGRLTHRVMQSEGQFYVHRDDEGDRTVTRLLARARQIRDGLDAPADPDGEFESVAANLAVVPPENIVVLGRDNDLYAVDTRLERRWVVMPRVAIRDPPLFLEGQNVPPAAATGRGGGKRRQTSPTTTRQLSISLVDMNGFDGLLPRGLTREDRARLVTMAGNDYCRNGVFGVGVNPILSGIVQSAHNVEWSLANRTAVLRSINNDLNILHEQGTIADRRRATLGLTRRGDITQVGESTVRRLIAAYEATLGRDVAMFDIRNMPALTADDDDARVRFNDGTRQPRPYDAQGAAKTFMYRRPVPRQPLADQLRFPPSPSPFPKTGNPLIPLKNMPMPRPDDVSAAANERREIARKIGSSRPSTIRITAMSSGASLYAAMRRRAGHEDKGGRGSSDKDDGGDEGESDGNAQAKTSGTTKSKRGVGKKSTRKGKRGGGRRRKGDRVEAGQSAADGEASEADKEDEPSEPEPEGDSDKSESRVRLDSQFDTVSTAPLRTRTVERILRREQIQVGNPRAAGASPHAHPRASGAARKRDRLTALGIPSSAPRVSGVLARDAKKAPSDSQPRHQAGRCDKPVADALSLFNLSFALSNLEQNDVVDEWVRACTSEADFEYLAGKAVGELHREIGRLMSGLAGEFTKGGDPGSGGTLKRTGDGGKSTTLDGRHVVRISCSDSPRRRLLTTAPNAGRCPRSRGKAAPERHPPRQHRHRCVEPRCAAPGYGNPQGRRRQGCAVAASARVLPGSQHRRCRRRWPLARGPMARHWPASAARRLPTRRSRRRRTRTLRAAPPRSPADDPRRDTVRPGSRKAWRHAVVGARSRRSRERGVWRPEAQRPSQHERVHHRLAGRRRAGRRRTRPGRACRGARHDRRNGVDTAVRAGRVRRPRRLHLRERALGHGRCAGRRRQDAGAHPLRPRALDRRVARMAGPVARDCGQGCESAGVDQGQVVRRGRGRGGGCSGDGSRQCSPAVLLLVREAPRREGPAPCASASRACYDQRMLTHADFQTIDPDFREFDVALLLRVCDGDYFTPFVERVAEQVQVAYDSLRPHIKRKGDRASAHLLVFEPVLQLFECAVDNGGPLWMSVQNCEAVKLRVKQSIVEGVGQTIQELRDRFGCPVKSLSKFVTDKGAQVEVMYQLFKTHLFPRTFFPTGHFSFSLAEISFVGHRIDRPKPWLVKKLEEGKGRDFLVGEFTRNTPSFECVLIQSSAQTPASPCRTSSITRRPRQDTGSTAGAALTRCGTTS
jgi:hypothetical protein